uniref:Uncharacterized protein n=2 Tax=Sus scrofa TaxID=9823 RepID=A0A8D1T4H6_PIG
MLEKSSTLPVALPWASCVWKTSLRVGTVGWGRLLPAASACSPSTSREVSLLLGFFFLSSPRGILPGRGRAATCAPTAASLAWAPGLCAKGLPARGRCSLGWANGRGASAWPRLAPRGQGPLLLWEELHLHAEQPPARPLDGCGRRKVGPSGQEMLPIIPVLQEINLQPLPAAPMVCPEGNSGRRTRGSILCFGYWP